ncbi:MAG TPA: hypothetical protein PK573_09210 [Spirochaetota bacterium]|nr:hypothetical protein [Spirochaetota bacterium]HRZ28187.1 hypothetical protein [Spirochaetota bacterium]
MGQAFLNPAFTALNGRVGGIVFYSHAGKTFFRSYVKPRNPDTVAQSKNRGLFRDAMKSWQALSPFDRDSFRRRARRLGMSGHNLFISRYMRTHRAEEGRRDAGAATVNLSRKDVRFIPSGSGSAHVLCRSVGGFMKAGATLFGDWERVAFTDGS